MALIRRPHATPREQFRPKTTEPICASRPILQTVEVFARRANCRFRQSKFGGRFRGSFRDSWPSWANRQAKRGKITQRRQEVRQEGCLRLDTESARAITSLASLRLCVRLFQILFFRPARMLRGSQSCKMDSLVAATPRHVFRGLAQGYWPANLAWASSSSFWHSSL